MTILTLFRHGFSLAARHWPLVFVLLIVNLLSAALLLLIPANTLGDAASFTAIRDAADGTDFWQLLDITQNAAIREQLNLTGADPITAKLGSTVLGIVGLLPIVAMVPAAFLKGGIYQTLHQSNQTHKDYTFSRAGWRWFGSFLLLACINLLVFSVVIIIASVLSAAVTGTSFVWVGILTVGLLLFFWWQVSELAGAFLIVYNRKNPFWGWLKAIGFVLEKFGRITAFYLLTLITILAVHYLFRFIIHPLIPLTSSLILLLINQLFIITRLWLKVARLGSITTMINATYQAELVDDEIVSAETTNPQPELIQSNL